jgi:hypothetical protein
MAMMFCNIGWMERYRGLKGQRDQISGGGSYVDENEHGSEVCNFLECRDGFTYGHVETLKGKIDRNIDIKPLGGGKPADDHVDGVDVIWTATHPRDGGRRVIGFYRNATVWRRRAEFPNPPSSQHRRDEIGNFRIRAHSSETVLFPTKDRTLRLKSGVKGWMGHVPWWFATVVRPDVTEFLKSVRGLLDHHIPMNDDTASSDLGDIDSPTYGFVKRLRRDRQPAFRSALLAAYNGCCAITGCNIEPCLEAAHLDRYADSGDNRSCNGILLRADLHRLMDAGLLTFHWNGGVLWTRLDGRIDDEVYLSLASERVELPPDPSCWPSKENVRRHSTGARAIRNDTNDG